MSFVICVWVQPTPNTRITLRSVSGQLSSFALGQSKIYVITNLFNFAELNQKTSPHFHQLLAIVTKFTSVMGASPVANQREGESGSGDGVVACVLASSSNAAAHGVSVRLQAANSEGTFNYLSAVENTITMAEIHIKTDDSWAISSISSIVLSVKKKIKLHVKQNEPE